MLTFFKSYYEMKRMYSYLPSWARLGYSKYSSIRRLVSNTEFKSQDELIHLQFEQLTKIVNHAWQNIGGYRTFWESNGFSPKLLKSPSHIRLIPTISKEQIRDNLDSFSFMGIRNLRMLTTGGSTGIPFAFYNSRAMELIEMGFMHDLWSRAYPRINLSTMSTILRGRQMEQPVAYDPLHGLILSSYELTPDNIHKYVLAIEKFKTPILKAYPSSLYVFASALDSMKLSIKHRFEAIMLGSEVLYDFQIEQIKRVFKTKVSHWYGHGERTLLAGNCEHSNALHAYPQYGIMEIVDKEGNEVDQGEVGEIIGTGFYNYATPFIRYRTMDLAEKGASFCSECGRQYPLINRVIGRDHEFVVSRNGKLVALTGVSITCGTFTQINQFRFYQDTPGTIVFNYIRRPGVDTVDEGFIRNSLLQKFGDGFDIVFEEVEGIEPTARGKFMYLDQRIDIKKYIPS